MRNLPITMATLTFCRDFTPCSCLILEYSVIQVDTKWLRKRMLGYLVLKSCLSTTSNSHTHIHTSHTLHTHTTHTTHNSVRYQPVGAPAYFSGCNKIGQYVSRVKGAVLDTCCRHTATMQYCLK